MSHLYFIHKDDIKNYELCTKAGEFLERCRDDEVRASQHLSIESEINKKYEGLWATIKSKYPYRSIGLLDDTYKDARKNGYVGYYRGFRWDRE